MKYIFSFGSVMILALFMVGCDNSNDPAAPTLESLDVTPKGQTLDVGTTEKYTAMANYSDNSYQDVSDQVTWSLVNDNGSVLFDQTDPSMARAVAVGTDTVVATLGTITSTGSENADVTVVNDTLASIAVTPVDQELIISFDHQYTATGTYADGRTQDLTDESDWTSANTSVTTVNAEGLVLPISEGNTTITASFDAQTDTTNVSVSDPNKIHHISISPDSREFFVEERQGFSAYAHFTDTDEVDEIITDEVLWSSSDTSIVALTVGVQSRPGHFTAKTVEGSASIIAELRSENLTATVDVTVEEPTVTRIRISPVGSADMTVGESRPFFTEAVDQRGKLYSLNEHPDLEYFVEDPTILSVRNDPGNQGWTKALKAGQVFVTSTFEYQGTIFASSTVITVTQ